MSRHISNMTLTAAPTFPQPNFYNAPNPSFPQRNPAPFSEYDQQLRYLANYPGGDDSGLWETTRNDAVRMLNEQAGPYVRMPCVIYCRLTICAVVLTNIKIQ